MAPLKQFISIYLLFIIAIFDIAAPAAIIGPRPATSTTKNALTTEEKLAHHIPTLPAPPTNHHHHHPTTNISPRSPQTFPPLGGWGEQFALPYGWSVTVSHLSLFMTIGSQSTLDWFSQFYHDIQISSLARMLSSTHALPPYSPLSAEQGPWRLVLGMHPESTVQELEWGFVYHFAGYMRNWVLHGFTGTGAIMFRHTSGIKLMAVFVNMDGSSGSVVH